MMNNTLAALLLAASLAGCADPLAGSRLPPAAPGASTSGMRDLTSLQLSRLMTPGINLGNTLEALPTETAWGNPPTTQATMDGFKAAGFRSVRIPVAWSQYVDANGQVSAAWMARVTQVVDYARRAGLYAVINVHWDGGWMDHPTHDQQAAINARLARLWTQIANHFKDYDDGLLFAGTNEVGMADTSGPPTPEYAEVQNSFNQTFVDTVRATGGNNARRHLVVQGYFTSIDATAATNTVPSDTTPGRLFMEVHHYSPYDFTLAGDGQAIWQWGRIATDPAATETWANEDYTDDQFQKMKARFVDHGVAVMVGEYGAYLKQKYPDMARFRNYWIEFNTRSMVQHGLLPMYWDAGGLFDRATGAQKEPDVIRLIVGAAK